MDNKVWRNNHMYDILTLISIYFLHYTLILMILAHTEKM